MHTDPTKAEAAQYSDNAYRYQVTAIPEDRADGKLCYSFEVDNVLLVPTLDIGEGTGVNHLIMTMLEVGGDTPTAPPIYKVARFTARYPVNGIKDPPDGVIFLTPTDFHDPSTP
jgi:hypothetical protein